MKRGSNVAVLLLLATVSSFADARLICRLKSGTDASKLATQYRVRLLDSTDGAPFAYFGLPGGDAGTRSGSQLKSDLSVVWAEADQGDTLPWRTLTKGSTLPAVGDRKALYEANSHVLAQINWSAALAASPGRTVKVAILDTGVTPYAVSIWNKVDASLNVIERGMPAYDMPQQQDTNNDGIPDGATGHGTMAASLIDQISPNSRLVIARIADSDGIATAWTLVKGLAFAVTSGAEVANVSLGTLSELPAIERVLNWCDSRDLLVVGAIGNNSLRTACYPAKYSDVVCVAGPSPDNTKAPFSNWHGITRVSAPATGIASQDWDGYIAYWSGTSCAAPMATATIAEALRLSPRRLSNSRLRKGFGTLAQDLNFINPDYKGQLGVLLDFVKYVTGFTLAGD